MYNSSSCVTQWELYLIVVFRGNIKWDVWNWTWTETCLVFNCTVNWEVENCHWGEDWTLGPVGEHCNFFVPFFFFFSRCLQMRWPRKQTYVIAWTRFWSHRGDCGGCLAWEAAPEKQCFSVSLPTSCVSVRHVICTVYGLPSCMFINPVTKFNKPTSPHHLPVHRSFTRQQLLPLLLGD